MLLLDEYNTLFPNFASRSFVNSLTIDEVETNSPDCKVRHATFIHVCGEEIPHNAVIQYRCMYDTAGTQELLKKNCDGVFCNQDGDTLILNMCELKSTASKSAIFDAKCQIVSVSTKLRFLLEHLKSYDYNIKVRGFIVARKPSVNYLSMFKKPTDLATREYLSFLSSGHSLMKKNKLEELFSPLKMVDINLYYAEVTPKKDKCTIDYSKIV